MKRRSRLMIALLFGGLTAGALALAVAGRGLRPAAGWALDRYLADRFEGVQTIGTAALADRLAGPHPPLLLDVRSAEEYAVSHLPGARWVAPDVDPAVALADVPRDRAVVVYCSVGWRSAAFAERMAGAGFGDVVNVEGSIFRWAIEDRPLVDGAGASTGQVHAFGPPWSWLLPPRLRAPLE